MLPAIAQKLDGIDRLVDNLYAELKDVPDDMLNKKPGTGQWSVLQVMHHLIIAEQLSEGYVRKKLSFQPELPKSGLAGVWRLLVVKVYFFLPFKFKAPKGVGDEVLPEVSTLAGTMDTWRNNRRSLRAYLNSLPESLFDKALYKHPLAGKLTLGQMLEFFDFHIRRHLGQIHRTLEAVKKV